MNQRSLKGGYKETNEGTNLFDDSSHCCASVGVVGARSVHYAEHSSNPLRFDVDTDKEQYLVGEEVHLNFKVVNQSDRAPSVRCIRVPTGWVDGYIDRGVRRPISRAKTLAISRPMWVSADAIIKSPFLNLENLESEAVNAMQSST